MNRKEITTKEDLYKVIELLDVDQHIIICHFQKNK